MPPLSSNNKRLAKNTLLLYTRMVVLMLVTLYTSRIILNSLGVVDYGIYNVVAGFVSMASIITGSLGAACSRFITFSLGKSDKEEQRKVFSMSVIIMLGISILIISMAEIFGSWFLLEKLNIPTNRTEASLFVFHCSVMSFFISLMSIPYNACIIAHEKMSAFAYITILDALLRLVLAWGLLVTPYDRLKTYAILLLIVAITVRSVYTFYCNRHFEECKLKLVFDRHLATEMFSFAGWSFIGCSAQVMINQGVNIITNLFFNVTSNAARGIASQLDGAVRQLVNNFMTALNPQITKTYASGEHGLTLNLVYKGAKYSFFLSLFFAIPFLLEMEHILTIWLKQYPEEAPVFARWTIAIILADVLSLPIITANAASGRVKTYQLVVGGYNMLIFPIVYLCFWCGLPAYSAYVVHFVVFFTNLFVRIRLMRNILPLTYSGYTHYVLLKVIPVFLLGMAIPYAIHTCYNEGITRLLLVGVATLMELPVLIYGIGLEKTERRKITEYAKQRISSKKR